MIQFSGLMLLLFLCNPVLSQEDPDFMLKAFEEMDSLKRVAFESGKAENYFFQITHKDKNGREYPIDYYCRVEKNKILFMNCSYSYFEKREGEYFDAYERPINYFDSTSYSEAYYLDNEKWVFCEQFLNEVYYEIPIDDSLNFQRYEGAPWSVHLSFYQGKMFSYFSNGHGLSETDEWQPEQYMRELYKEHLTKIRKKYPKWR